jgi:biopolymer transport protein ExbB
MTQAFRTARLPLLLIAATLLPTVAALAQEGDGDDAGSQSFFQAFFWSENIFGLILIWLLLLMSALAIALTIKFTIDYRRPTVLPADTQERVEAMLSEKKYRDAIQYTEEDDSYLANITHAALSEASNGFGAMERAVEEAADAETAKMLRPIEYLNVLGNISPMVGLFGTVFGMILAFSELVAAGGSPDPAELAAGISTALVTTFWGLVVAIPALTAYALIRNKIDALTSEGMLIAEDLIQPFKPSRRSSSSSSSSSSRPRATPKPEGSGKDRGKDDKRESRREARPEPA